MLLVQPASGRRRVPYYTLDDGYARTGFGAFAPLWSDVPEVPAAAAAAPQTAPRPAAKAARSVVQAVAASAAAVTLAGLVGAGLGAAGSALVAARSIPAFDAAAGA